VSVVNLNKARKAKAKSAGKTTARENRVRFGLTKTQKAAGKTAARKAAQSLDQAKREP
jgi:hypothetical protein